MIYQVEVRVSATMVYFVEADSKKQAIAKAAETASPIDNRLPDDWYMDHHWSTATAKEQS